MDTDDLAAGFADYARTMAHELGELAAVHKFKTLAEILAQAEMEAAGLVEERQAALAPSCQKRSVKEKAHQAEAAR
jgi:hypothetical protein